MLGAALAELISATQQGGGSSKHDRMLALPERTRAPRDPPLMRGAACKAGPACPAPRALAGPQHPQQPWARRGRQPPACAAGRPPGRCRRGRRRRRRRAHARTCPCTRCAPPRGRPRGSARRPPRCPPAGTGARSARARRQHWAPQRCVQSCVRQIRKQHTGQEGGRGDAGAALASGLYPQPCRLIPPGTAASSLTHHSGGCWEAPARRLCWRGPRARGGCHRAWPALLHRPEHEKIQAHQRSRDAGAGLAPRGIQARAQPRRVVLARAQEAALLLAARQAPAAAARAARRRLSTQPKRVSRNRGT
jgi:hypothetical protein